MKRTEAAPETDARELAQALGEASDVALAQISEAVRSFGLPFVRDAFKETQAIEAKGGELIRNGKRRRTPGGVFFRRINERIKAYRKVTRRRDEETYFERAAP